MRFNYPKAGETRRRQGFLFLPKTIAGQVRWLEHAVWKEIYENCGVDGWEWTPTEWDDCKTPASNTCECPTPSEEN